MTEKQEQMIDKMHRGYYPVSVSGRHWWVQDGELIERMDADEVDTLLILVKEGRMERSDKVIA